eukprot:TRINITY_DN3564_c0_g1_i1.p1 TRINITY_DN3564_c0_g1~~TRINITY_DN3564_c0_g1_i1.p1  ORF type:complete len:207 (-),score=27.79 TRINITY_DN3564_c0_g1_i1:118-663(-)
MSTDPLDIAFGWNSMSKPFWIYESKGDISKKIYSCVRGEEIYVTDVGTYWVAISSPMPGFVRITRDDLKYVKQVKQFTAAAEESLAQSEGLFHAKAERQATSKNLICATDEEDKFIFPHGEKFEIEFGWFQTLPTGLKIYKQDKLTVQYTLVSGEEVHVVERKDAWVKLDSPVEGFLEDYR